MLRRLSMLAVVLLAATAPAAPAEGWQEPWPEGPTVRGSGRVITEVRDVRGFTGVELKGGGELTILRGRSEKLVIEAEDTIVDVITTDVEHGVLSISYGRGGRPVSIRPTRPVRFTLTMRDVARIASFGSGSVQAADLPGSLEVATFGSGEVLLTGAMLEELKVTIAGSGGVEVDGTAERLHVSVAGSGDCRAGRLASRSVEVRIAGSGSVVAGPADNLDVSILGSGSVSYHGRPRVTQTVLGSGSIRSLDAGF